MVLLLLFFHLDPTMNKTNPKRLPLCFDYLQQPHDVAEVGKNKPVVNGKLLFGEFNTNISTSNNIFEFNIDVSLSKIVHKLAKNIRFSI